MKNKLFKNNNKIRILIKIKLIIILKKLINKYSNNKKINMNINIKIILKIRQISLRAALIKMNIMILIIKANKLEKLMSKMNFYKN